MSDLTPMFEKKWAEYIGTKYAVFCNSGSSANLLMVAAAIQSGRLRNRHVAVPSVGWGTTIAPVMQLGLEPIMVGSDVDTFGINLDDLDACEQLGAVIFVQVLGVPHKKERLLSIQKKRGFLLLEDACASLGAEYADGSKVGTVGDMASFSFYFGHQLSTIEGGMVNTDDYELYQILLMLRSHGWGKDLDGVTYDKLMSENNIDDFHKPFTFFLPGFNVRPTDVQAFLGLKQMDKADWVANRRYENHKLYYQRLRQKFFCQDWGNNKPVSISFGLLAASEDERKGVVKRLVERGIETRVFSAGNLGRHPFWTNNYGIFEDEMSDNIHKRGFFLPNYPELTLEQVDYICDVVLEKQSKQLEFLSLTDLCTD